MSKVSSTRFLKILVIVVIISVLIGSLAGILVFATNSQKGPIPFDIQGPVALASFFLSIATTIIGGLAIYFFLYIEDNYRKEAKVLSDLSGRLSNSIQLFASHLAAAQSVRGVDERQAHRMKMLGVQRLFEAFDEWINKTRALQVIPEIYKPAAMDKAEFVGRLYARICAYVSLDGFEAATYRDLHELRLIAESMTDVDRVARVLSTASTLSIEVENIRRLREFVEPERQVR